MLTRDKFLQELYSYCEGLLELRALPSKHRSFFDVTDYKKIDTFCNTHQTENVYFGLALRNGHDGTKSSITQIACVHCDLDFKDISEKEAIKRIKSFELVPTLIVRSGGGFHLYWRLKEAYEPNAIPEIEKINKAIAGVLGGDLNACDASRILRMPETANVKYTPPQPVKCTKFENIDYDVDDFGTVLAIYNTSTSSIKHLDSNHILEHSLPDSSGQFRTVQDIDFTEGSRDASLFHVANCLIKGGMTGINTEKVLQNLASCCSPPFPDNEIQTKIKSALNRSDRRGKTLSDEVREWVIRTDGDFFGTEADKELSIRTVQDKANRTKILQRMCEEGIIERVGNRRGCFRLIVKDCDDIDYKNTETEPMFFYWPLEKLSTMIEVFPGNIIVIAGVQNAGKTAFLLDFTFKNINKYKINYFSSEMGDMELRKRLLMFNTPIEYWDSCIFKERSSNFSDVIRSNDINIIDYLEIHENFYAVGGMLKAIHDKLNKGIAIIALQKNPGAETGIGGYRGLEKPRLYLNLDPDYPGGKATIVKAKNWATNMNPNGYSVKFKLISGCHFVEDGQWNRL